MIKSVLSKIKNNIWMFVCLIIGSLLITSVLACIPMYTMGTLKQMLSTEMKAWERENEKPAGQMMFSGKIPVQTFGASRGKKANEIEEMVIGGLEDTAVSYYNTYTYIYSANFQPAERGGKTFEYSNQWNISTLTGLENNVTLVEGALYTDGGTDGAIDVLVEKTEWEQNPKVELGSVYEFVSNGITISVRPVGVFEITDEESAFWYNNSTLFSETLFCTRTAYENFFYTSDGGEAITGISVYANLDFSKAGIENLSTFVEYYQKLYAYMKELGTGRGNLSLNTVKLINAYIKKTTKMQMSLWVLNVPVIAMLAFYMIMVTKMIIEEDKNEISTFKSRGAKTSHIFARYVVECLFISVFAIVLGPLFGFVLAKTVGNASGFLEFNAREIMPIRLSFSAYVYAIIACLFFSSLILIPALQATKGTIVNLKQHRARKSRKSWWEKWFVDFLCLGASIGLFFIYKRTGGFNVDGTVDPVVYVISSLFILGCGLVFLRIYPFVVALIFKIFKRIMPPAGYSAFVQVSRGGNDYRFLMLFLVMTISVGIYSSASARIINNNVENTVEFENGADVVINPDLTDYAPYVTEEDGSVVFVPESFRHFPIEDYQSNEYIEYVSRVEHSENVYGMDVERGYWHEGFEILAIDPYEFGNISWCATSLNGVNWHEYLNVLELSPTACVISSTAAARMHAEVGKMITLEINSSNEHEGESFAQVQCYVAAIVDYWPTLENGAYSESFEDEERIQNMGASFIIMNFEYLYSVRDTHSFQLYAKLTDDAKKGQEDFTEKAIASGLINDEDQVLIYRPDLMENAKSDSMLRGLNGSYSIGFVSTLTVAFVGFLIYWIMNVRKRKLQFGILRAMGLTKGKLTSMLVTEHLLTTGVSVLMGILIGALTVKVYTPLLKVAYSDGTLPLEIIFNRGDNLKIYGVVIAMIVVGVIVLAAFINKLKINEAVKIGEE